MTEQAAFALAYILDLAVGDPRRLPHPVRGIGWMIVKMEKILRKAEGKDLSEKLSGILLVVVVVGTTYLIFYIFNSVFLASHFSLLTYCLLFTMFVCLTSTTLATNDLIKSCKAVIDALNSGNKEEAREKLGMIVGRDTKHLENKGMAKATIETLAENTSDGIIAPMFYFAIGGLPLAMAYKAVNTLDSMIGYRNERYRHFGWASARIDDIVNYIPARITGILIAVSSFILNLSPVTCHSSLKIMLRDGRKHLSPNSGFPEAAMAGALGVRLGGPSTYGGALVEKPYIGEDKSEVRSQKSEVKDRISCHLYLDASEDALTIVKLTSFLGFGLVLISLFVRAII